MTRDNPERHERHERHDSGLLNPYSDENVAEELEPVDWGPAQDLEVMVTPDDQLVISQLQHTFEEEVAALLIPGLWDQVPTT